MQKFTLPDGTLAFINRVGAYVEVKLLAKPSRGLTSQLCNIRDHLVVSGYAQNILVTLDALSFISDKDDERIMNAIINVDSEITSFSHSEFCIEVNYNGRDITSICEMLNITKKDLIEIHTSGKYYVGMQGFLPGFPYIGGLPSQLHLPRKSQADNIVPIGSVAIAMEYTGIYPQQSPGGWHILGHTTFKNFDIHATPSFKLNVGDVIRFKSLGI